MIEDKLSKDERIHLEALAQANMTWQMSPPLTRTPKDATVLKTAEKYEEYIRSGKVPDNV